jgi:hypothetical protein
MRAVVFLVNICVLAVAYWLGSLTGLLIAVVVCLASVAGFFVLSMARTEAQESKSLQRAMGRNTTFLAKLRDR